LEKSSRALKMLLWKQLSDPAPKIYATLG